MSFLVYFAMLVAALVSVVMGLDVVSTPPVRTAKPALVEPIRHAAPVPAAAPSQPAVAQQPAPQTVPRQTVSQSSEPAAIAAPEVPSAAPACNVQACEAAYRSFTAADCTYQPNDGPRRLCTKK